MGDMLGRKSRTYGHDKTIHQTSDINVEIHDGKVVAVWFRCQPLPFTESDFGPERAEEMRRMYEKGDLPGVLAVELSE